MTSCLLCGKMTNRRVLTKIKSLITRGPLCAECHSGTQAWYKDDPQYLLNSISDALDNFGKRCIWRKDR